MLQEKRDEKGVRREKKEAEMGGATLIPRIWNNPNMKPHQALDHPIP
jgi:hypothetical protein